MRFHCLKLRGISEAFPSEVELDLDALGPGLIAIVGENGAGKSTLIGCLFASLFRQLPGQKRPLYDFATHPQPEIDVCFTVNGERYRSILKINPQGRQMESYLFRGDGTPLSDGKKESFQEAVQRLAGSRTLFEASIFSNQKRAGNFLSLDRAQRKEVFVSQLLGLDRLRRLSVMAKEEAESAGREITGLEGERKVLLGELAQRSSLADPEAIQQALHQVAARIADVDTTRSALATRLGELERDLGSLHSLEANREMVARRQEKVAREIATAERVVEEDRRLLERRAALNGTPEKLAELARTIRDLHVRMERAQSAEAANREVDWAVQTVERELSTIRGELERAQLECNELAIVPCRGLGEFANCPKIQRAVRSQRAIPDLEGTIATLELEQHVHRGGLVTVGVTSAQVLRRIQETERERQKLEAQVRQHEELNAVEVRHAERLQALNRLRQEHAGSYEELSRLRSEIGRYEGTLQERAVLRQKLAGAESELRTLQARKEDLIVQKAQVEQARIEAARSAERLRELEERSSSARRERDDWDYLARVFGADEIQLLEIQSAGPGISGIVNDLLEGCLDNKFEIRFRTQRPKADGRGLVDDFDVEVRNKVLDRAFSVEELSGGQFVLVNEALNLGIAMYNATKGEGVRYETLFRDETIGALDSRNGVEYIRMLRRAMEVGGFHQVVFISHTASVWELADRIVRVKDGRVEVGVTAESQESRRF